MDKVYIRDLFGHDGRPVQVIFQVKWTHLHKKHYVVEFVHFVNKWLALMLTDEYRYKILKLIDVKPDISQRELASELGISLGKTNYCLKALIEKGVLKARNFRNSNNKLAYMYFLTPQGIEEKSSVTVRFLKRKVREYEALAQEIEQLRRDVEVTGNQDCV